MSRPAGKQQIILVTRVIHWGLLSALVLYGIVGFFMNKGSTPEAEPTGLHPMVIPLAAVGLVNLVLAYFIKTIFADASIARGTLNLDQLEHRARYLAVHVMAFALAESVGIFGLVLRMLGSSMTVLLCFVIASIIGLLVLAPSAEGEAGQP